MNTNTELSNPSSSQRNRSLFSFDYIFIVIIALLLAAGIKLTEVRNRPSPFGVSVLFGSAMSLLTYYFLGGINKNDASVEAGFGGVKVKLLSSMAALAGCTIVTNFFLEKQMRNPSLSHHPDDNDLLIIDRDGIHRKEFKILGNFGGVSEEKPITVSDSIIKKVVKVCHQGKGFCKPETIKVKFRINNNLNKQYASVCQNHDLHSYRLMITSSKPRTEALPVTVIADRTCILDKDPSLMEISEEDAKLLKVNDNSSGFATIPPLLITQTPMDIYKKDRE